MRGKESDIPALAWDRLEPIANNDVVRFVGLVPLFGYLILFNDSFVDALNFNRIAGISHTDGSSPFLVQSITKLRLAFFGGLFLFLANLIFRTFSPRALKNSKGDLEFSERVLESYSLREITTIEAAVLQKNWPHRTGLAKDIQAQKHFAHVGAYRTKHQFQMTDHDWVKAIAREWWLNEMHSNPLARYATFLFSVIGYIMLAIPTLDITQAVVRDVLGGSTI